MPLAKDGSSTHPPRDPVKNTSGSNGGGGKLPPGQNRQGASRSPSVYPRERPKWGFGAPARE